MVGHKYQAPSINECFLWLRSGFLALLHVTITYDVEKLHAAVNVAQISFV